MKRRGFFGTVVGLCLGALGVKAKPPPGCAYVMGVDPATDCQKETMELIPLGYPGWRNYTCTYSDLSKDDFDVRMERAMRKHRPEPPLKEPLGIEYWLKS